MASREGKSPPTPDRGGKPRPHRRAVAEFSRRRPKCTVRLRKTPLWRIAKSQGLRSLKRHHPGQSMIRRRGLYSESPPLGRFLAIARICLRPRPAVSARRTERSRPGHSAIARFLPFSGRAPCRIGAFLNRPSNRPAAVVRRSACGSPPRRDAEQRLRCWPRRSAG